jgi:uncharacterized protein related to proFAR isomerase
MAEVEITIKDILEKDVDKEKKVHHKGRRRKKEYIPIYDKIETGDIPLRITIGKKNVAWNLYIALRNYIKYHEKKFPYVKVTFESDKKGKFILEILEKSREERRI